MFDHPENVAQIPLLQRLTLQHDKGHRSTALLLTAWIAAQLDWKFLAKDDGGFRFEKPTGGEVRAELQETEGAPIGCCTLATDASQVTVSRDPESLHHRAEVRLSDGKVYHHLLPAGPDDLCNLLSEELMRGGKHRVYLKALRALMPLL